MPMPKLISILSVLLTKELIVSNAQWPKPRYYNFTATTESKNITNCGVSVCAYDVNANNLLAVHQFDNLAFYADRENGDGGCFLSTNFCSSDYLVELGTISSKDVPSLKAYIIYPGKFIIVPPQSFIMKFILRNIV